MALSAKIKKYFISSSPLIIFIKDKTKNFIESKAERSSRGRPPSFGREKYAASFYMLHPTSLKEIAAKLKVPYALMRKWAIDPEFKKQVQINSAEFLEEYMRLLVEEMETIQPTMVLRNFLVRVQSEVSMCNPFVQKEILERVSKLKYERPDLIILLVDVALVLILTRYRLASEKKMGRRVKKKDITELVKFEKEIVISFKDFIGDELIKILNKGQVTDEDKNKGTDLISTLKEIGGLY